MASHRAAGSLRRAAGGEGEHASSAGGGGYGRHVICIYTRDWQDVAEVQRVREVLRAAGFNERLGYKRDADTRAGSERYVYEG